MFDLMLDLETWGTTPGSALRSIGAVAFNPKEEGSIAAQFYTNIRLSKQYDFSVDPATSEWWGNQSPEAQAAFHSPTPVGIEMALSDFANFVKSIEIQRVWAHRLAFDIPIIEAAFRIVGATEVPWNFWMVRDTITHYEATDFDHKSIPFVGTPHHALFDATHQARCVQACNVHLRNQRASHRKDGYDKGWNARGESDL